MNSFVPNWLVSIEFHARSSTRGRCGFGPTPSSQLSPDTTFPPGYRVIGTPRSLTSRVTSVRKPFASASGEPGSYTPV